MNLDTVDAPLVRSQFEYLQGLSSDRWCPTLMDWLVGTDEQRSGLALQILKRLGRNGVFLLLREALAPRRRADRRILFLDALQRLGEPLDLNQWFMLSSVTGRFGPEVGEKIARVLIALGHAIRAST